MPTTIRPAAHPARECRTPTGPISAENLLKCACSEEQYSGQRIFQSSFTNPFGEPSTWTSNNGFVHGAISAYNSHHHLCIRPEDVWFTILTQLGFFVNKNAEELRSFFVSHQGKKKLTVYTTGTIDTVNIGELAIQMTDVIAKNVVDPDLRNWIMPNFSTTTESDKVVASVLMMGALQEYFDYRMCCLCGLPSVTLLGERSDWEEMLKRLEMLPQLGSEPTQFYQLLKPVLTSFVASFDAPEDPSVIDFWQKIVHSENNGSGPTYLSGWITAFCFWTSEGKCLVGPYDRGVELVGVRYHVVDLEDVPQGYAAVPVEVDDNGKIYSTRMVAGSVGIRLSSSGEPLDGQERAGMDTMQPLSGWWMYEKVEASLGEQGEAIEETKRLAEERVEVIEPAKASAEEQSDDNEELPPKNVRHESAIVV